MIFQLLFSIIFGLLGVLLFFMPGFGDVPLLLPWGLDDVFVSVSSWVAGAVETFPFLSVVMDIFLYILLFEIALMVLKLFLGARAPSTN